MVVFDLEKFDSVMKQYAVPLNLSQDMLKEMVNASMNNRDLAKDYKQITKLLNNSVYGNLDHPTPSFDFASLYPNVMHEFDPDYFDEMNAHNILNE